MVEEREEGRDGKALRVKGVRERVENGRERNNFSRSQIHTDEDHGEE